MLSSSRYNIKLHTFFQQNDLKALRKSMKKKLAKNLMKHLDRCSSNEKVKEKIRREFKICAKWYLSCIPKQKL